MQEKFEGQDCPPLLRGLGMLPPQYLSVAGQADCLSHQKAEPNGHMEKCLPLVKPDVCSPDAWRALTDEGKFIGRQCRAVQIIGLPAPIYTQVPGYEKCLGSKQSSMGTHQELCLPSRQPSACNERVWKKLQEVFVGDDCDSQSSSPSVPILGGESSLPPKYLSIVGHRNCLGSQHVRGASHTELCLPDAKPSRCNPNSWAALQDEVSNGGINKCLPKLLGGVMALPPKYLSIDGHKDCLSSHSPRVGATHTEICLPSSKPSSCSAASWDKLKDEVSARRIDKCNQPVQILGGQSGLPPSYLSITGHGECLSSHTSTPGASHNEVCIPKSKPEDCTSEAWQNLSTELSQGNLKQCRMPIIGFPIKPILGGGLQALPPKYLQVDGWRECTRGFEASDAHTEHCLPLSKPAQPCTPQAYNELLQIVFEVERTGSFSPGILDARPPEYLFVDGYPKCLDDINVGNHKEMCMPSNRPNGCQTSTWIQLQNVFNGKPCKRKS